MYAIVKTGGKQHKVKVGDELLIERFKTAKSAKSLKLDHVLAVSKDGSLEVGRPFVKGAYCEVELLKEVRGEKSISFKYIRREKSATKKGHRQNYFKIKIKSIHHGT